MVACRVVKCGYNEKGMCGKGFLSLTDQGLCGYLYSKNGQPRGILEPGFNPEDEQQKEIKILETQWIEEENK